MRSPDERSNQSRSVVESTHRKRLGRTLLWSALFVGGFAIAGCGSDSSDEAAPTIEGALGDQLDGVQVDSDQLDDLAEAQAKLTDLQESGALGTGSGVITVQDVEYSFDAVTCRASDVDFEASGPGRTADGVPFWASITHYVETRAGMEGAGLPQASIDAFFGDRDSIDLFDLELELGKEDRFSGGDDSMANYALSSFGVVGSETADYTIQGNTISGSGSVYDNNGVSIEYNQLAPVTFSATCD